MNNQNYNQNFNFQEFYNRQIATLVFTPPKENQTVKLKSSTSSIMPTTIAIIFSLFMAGCAFLFNYTYYGFFLLLPSLYFIVSLIITLSKLKTVKINNDGIFIKHTFASERHYVFSDIQNFIAFPLANSTAFNTNYANAPKKLLIFEFSDGKKFQLPIMVVSFGYIYGFLKSNIKSGFEAELNKIRDFYFKLNIDIENLNENAPPKQSVESPFEGF